MVVDHLDHTAGRAPYGPHSGGRAPTRGATGFWARIRRGGHPRGVPLRVRVGTPFVVGADHGNLGVDHGNHLEGNGVPILGAQGGGRPLLNCHGWIVRSLWVAHTGGRAPTRGAPQRDLV